jgi:hypothetical protein
VSSTIEPSAPTEQQRELVVFSVRRDTHCSERGGDLGRGSLLCREGGGVLCLECADPDLLEYLPRGDATLTRRARKYSTLQAVVVEWSRTRQRYERQGVLVSSPRRSRRRKRSAWQTLTRAQARTRSDPTRCTGRRLRSQLCRRDPVRLPELSDCRSPPNRRSRLPSFQRPHRPNRRRQVTRSRCRQPGGRRPRTAHPHPLRPPPRTLMGPPRRPRRGSPTSRGCPSPVGHAASPPLIPTPLDRPRRSCAGDLRHATQWTHCELKPIRGNFFWLKFPLHIADSTTSPAPTPSRAAAGPTTRPIEANQPSLWVKTARSLNLIAMRFASSVVQSAPRRRSPNLLTPRAPWTRLSLVQYHNH